MVNLDCANFSSNFFKKARNSSQQLFLRFTIVFNISPVGGLATVQNSRLGKGLFPDLAHAHA